jgi:hypothetical protein
VESSVGSDGVGEGIKRTYFMCVLGSVTCRRWKGSVESDGVGEGIKRTY